METAFWLAKKILSNTNHSSLGIEDSWSGIRDRLPLIRSSFRGLHTNPDDRILANYIL